MDTATGPTRLTPPSPAPTRPRVLLATINAAALIGVLVVLLSLQPAGHTFRLGEVSSTTVIAQHRATYVDHTATTAKQQEAAATVSAVYKSNLAQARLRKRQAAAFLSGAIGIINSARPPTQKLLALRRLLPSHVSTGALQQFPYLGRGELRTVSDRSLALLSQSLAWRFDANQVTPIEIGLLGSLPPQVTVRERTAIGEVLATFLAPTIVSDTAATARKQREAAAQVPEVLNTIQPGEVVIRRGDLVTPDIMEKLTALGLQTQRAGWRDVAAAAIFTIVIIGMLFWYLRAFHPSITTNPRMLFLVDASILAAVAGVRLLASGHALLPFFLPVAALSTFAAVLVAPEACLAITCAMAVLAGWIVANSFELTLYYFATGAAGALAIYQVRQLKQFILAGVYITLIAMCTALAFGLLDRASDLSALQQYMFAAAFNGFVSSSLALGGFVLLSDFFGVTTAFQLLELVQPDQRLLRRLMVQAPGTYNHSLILASMIERAAEEVNANSLVAKVGALYHDVGKVTNPHAFVENQFGIANIHDELRPEESARIIRGHVTQGLRLARQHRLPRAILDAIAEHHGTMQIAYFLHRARQEQEDVDLSIYTYAGPRPQSKETSLLMLADGCETAVRASSDRSYEKIQETVRRIFQERIDQGQLDESPLTLQDLERARAAFCSVLNGLYHPRIEYPEPSEVVVETRPGLSVVRGKRLSGGS